MESACGADQTSFSWPDASGVDTIESTMWQVEHPPIEHEKDGLKDGLSEAINSNIANLVKNICQFDIQNTVFHYKTPCSHYSSACHNLTVIT